LNHLVIHDLLKELVAAAAAAAAKAWSSRFLRKMLMVYRAKSIKTQRKFSIIFINVYRIKMFLIRLRERYIPLSQFI